MREDERRVFIIEAKPWRSALRAVLVATHGSGRAELSVDEDLNCESRAVVLSWARREIARGTQVSWLLADELAGLP